MQSSKWKVVNNLVNQVRIKQVDVKQPLENIKDDRKKKSSWKNPGASLCVKTQY